MSLHPDDAQTLRVLRESETEVVLLQADKEDQDPEDDLADAWEFHLKWDGCVNFGQRQTGRETGYTHICNIELMIKLLQKVQEQYRVRFAWKDREHRD